MGIDIHLVKIPTPGGPVDVPLPHPFVGSISGGVSSNVKVMGQPAAILGSEVKAQPQHIPMGAGFTNNPQNKGQVVLGSATVLINNKPAARMGDSVSTCDDILPINMNSKIIAAGTVLVGG